MALTINQAKNTYNNSSTLTASDLLNNEFGDIGGVISQIAPGTTVGDTAFLKAPNMSNILANLEKSFDTTVGEFQKYFSDVYRDTRSQSDIAFQESARRTAELGQGMSTGQSAISKQDLSVAQQATNEQLAQTVEQQYTESVSQLQTAFGEQLTQLFGKIDDSGRFSALSEYASYADKATDALMHVAAKMMKDTLSKDAINLAKNKGYLDSSGNIINATGFLQEQGILEVDMASGGYYLSDAGYNYIDAILNSELAVNGQNNTYDKIIDQMIDAAYDLDVQDNWSDIKRQEIEQQYADFLSDYSQEWRYTHVGLWKQTPEGIEIDTYWSAKDQVEASEELNATLGIRNDIIMTSGSIGEDNIEVSFDGETYEVEVDKDKLSTNIADKINTEYLKLNGTEVPEKTIVKYGDNLYIRDKNNSFYRLDMREWFNSNNYDKLMSKLTGKKIHTRLTSYLTH